MPARRAGKTNVGAGPKGPAPTLCALCAPAAPPGPEPRSPSAIPIRAIRRLRRAVGGTSYGSLHSHSRKARVNAPAKITAQINERPQQSSKMQNIKNMIQVRIARRRQQRRRT